MGEKEIERKSEVWNRKYDEGEGSTERQVDRLREKETDRGKIPKKKKLTKRDSKIKKRQRETEKETESEIIEIKK